MASHAAKVRRMLNAMEAAARVATAMVDGDEARRILSQRTLRYAASPDPEVRGQARDFHDVEHGPSLRTKKTLLRLERLLEFRCNTALWITIEGVPGEITLVVQNGDVHRYYEWNEARVPLEGEMARCIESGQITVGAPDHPSETLTVLAPVRDSLGDVVGLVELSARHPASGRPAAAWS